MAIKKVVLVTGAAKGIGLEVCRQLAGLGYSVILTARNAEAGQQAADSLNQEHAGSARFMQMDVVDANSVNAAKAQLQTEGITLFGLINNAGVLPEVSHRLEDGDAKATRLIFETNALAPSWILQMMLPLLERGSRVVNVSSGMGKFCDGFTNYAPLYSASKTALNALTRHWAATLQSRGIAVNAVDPGWVKTDMGGTGAPRTVERGASGIVWLIDQAPEGKTGLFWRDGREIGW